ncbi:MAG: hypothetical protein ACXWQ5_00955 [Ktedonobacterales bacterium]
MSTKENIELLLVQLCALNTAAPDAGGRVARLLSTLSLLLLKDHPDRAAIESLVAKALTVALDITEPHINSMN